MSEYLFWVSHTKWLLENVLSNTQNGIQDDIWNIILKKGQGTVLDFADYNKESVEKAMNKNPKIIFKF